MKSTCYGKTSVKSTLAIEFMSKETEEKRLAHKTKCYVEFLKVQGIETDEADEFCAKSEIRRKSHM